MALLRLAYRPFGLIARWIARRISRAAFAGLWARIDDAPPPVPGSGEGGAVKAVAAQALRAGVAAGVGAAVDGVFARAFHHLFGAWPRRPSARPGAER
ncbi:MAG TPA: hypothetical protein VKV27_02765 [Solirubrobacteraceae bacterium]|nr:hypothetical protein [Solirubrobacteraceae bacterium]